ncbi:flavin monoamine oxidase family protein [Sorangium sp. So ce388]|uniref:flavin monoamine oxidase family protein n=1 Tax=Sorangium sp. So ce388 TaxID=3133309 RepID=UPI003F5B133D
MSENASDKVWDVIVIGGGVAGLTAALWLTDQNSFEERNNHPENKKSFLLLEKQGRLGGRAETASNRPDIDLGAAYFGPLQSYTMRLCDRLQIERIDNDLPRGLEHRAEWSDGSPIFTFKDKSFAVPRGRTFMKRALFDLGVLGGFYDANEPSAEEELSQVMGELEALVLSMRNDLNDPAGNRAKELDRYSVEEWIQARNIQSRSVGDLLRVGVRAALSADPGEVSMLYLIYYTATGGSFTNVMAVGGGADSFRFKHGATTLADKLKSTIADGNIRLSTKVTRIEEAGNAVKVFTDQGTFVAERCIVAMSPPQVGSIALEPAQGVPRQRTELPKVMRMGRTIKAFVTFKNAWWRALGSSGYALSAREPVVWTMDNTWPDHAAAEHHTLMAFIVGEQADRLESLEPAERMDQIIAHWARIFELDAQIIRHQLVKDEKERYHERVWGANSSWSRGGPAAFFPPGTFLDYWPYLRQPAGRIHWAGSETATDWVGGYMNGAIQSGIRAAEEALKPLR